MSIISEKPSDWRDMVEYADMYKKLAYEVSRYHNVKLYHWGLLVRIRASKFVVKLMAEDNSIVVIHDTFVIPNVYTSEFMELQNAMHASMARFIDRRINKL